MLLEHLVRSQEEHLKVTVGLHWGQVGGGHIFVQSQVSQDICSQGTSKPTRKLYTLSRNHNEGILGAYSDNG